MRIIAFIIALLAAAPAFGQGTTPAPRGQAARDRANMDAYVSTLDAIGGTSNQARTFAGAFRTCNASVAPQTFCQFSASASGQTGNTLTGVTLPLFIQNGLTVTGTNIPGSTTIASFTGTGGGTGSVTLNNAPTGTVGSFNVQQPTTISQFLDNGNAVPMTITPADTTTPGGQTFTSSVAFCNANMDGLPIANSTLWPADTRILHCTDTTHFTTSKGSLVIPSGSYVVSWGIPAIPIPASGWIALAGNLFGSADNTGAVTAPTISAVFQPAAGATGAAYVQTSTGSNGLILNASLDWWRFGYDDSVAISGACTQAIADQRWPNGAPRQLVVPIDHFAPNASQLCDAVARLGDGTIWRTDNTTNGANRDLFAIPISAREPPPPRQTIVFTRDFPAAMAAGMNFRWVNTYDSRDTIPTVNTLNPDSVPGIILEEFNTQNRGFVQAFGQPAGSSGAGILTFIGNPAAPSGKCNTVTNVPTITQIGLRCPGPIISAGSGGNDGTNMNPLSMLDAHIRVDQNALNELPVQANLYFDAGHNKTIALNSANSGGMMELSSHAMGWLASFPAMFGRPALDEWSYGAELMYGFNPGETQWVRGYDVPYSANFLSSAFVANRFTLGAAATFYYPASSVAPASYFATNQSSYGDTRFNGNIVIQVGGVGDGTSSFGNILFVGELANTHWGYECDANNETPGLACKDPATGLAPTQPASPKESMTLANTGAGARAKVSLAAGNFVWRGAATSSSNCPPAGTYVTIPGGGFHVTNANAFNGGYFVPWIDTIAACNNDGTIETTNPATTPFAGVVRMAFWGNPVIDSGVVVAAAPSNDLEFFAGWSPRHLALWFNDPAVNGMSYQGDLARGDERFQQKIWNGGSPGGLYVRAEGAGATGWQWAQPIPNRITMPEAVLFGPNADPPLSNPGNIGTGAGSGESHSTSAGERRLASEVIHAQNWRVPNGWGVQKVASGAANTVASCYYGRVLVNDATTNTLTLPNWCPNPIKVIDVGPHATAHPITVVIANGTIAGTAVISTDSGVLEVTYADTAGVAVGR